MPSSRRRNALPICFPRRKPGSSQCKKSPSLAANLHPPATEHVSGYHMAVVAGMIFFAVRALFALLPAFSNRHPIKKWAALAALGAAAFYLLLSGAEVATQRSFIMVAIVLIGIMVDRPTLTFR